MGGHNNEASKVADIDSPGYKILSATIDEVFPDAVSAPFLVIGGSDARHFDEVSDNVLRFLPIRLAPEDLKRLHGVNERVSVGNYAEIVEF